MRCCPTPGRPLNGCANWGKRPFFYPTIRPGSRTVYAEKLTRLGLPTPAADVINSSYVMVDFLQRRLPAAHLFVVGEESLCAELAAAGFTLTDKANEVDAVIASFDRTFDYRKLQIAFDAIRAGARFFATNADRYCPVPGGGEPDAAAMIAAIEACTNTTIEAVVGKPSRYMAEAILELAGVPANRCLMTGDRWETDVLMGLEAGMDAALTLTGATTLADLKTAVIAPTYVIEHLGELVA
jgi:HAD superfamily hydrolase (TIGR01450 family)